jgi:UDP-N-acetyl-2-amino-2-deoxyglucuronate dehydrogenase
MRTFHGCSKLTGKSDSIRVGIIGTGIVAREHAKAISMVPGTVTLTAAVDIASARLQEFCDTFSVSRKYHDAADLIADADVDLVTIATPPAAHEAIAVAALQHGKYVLCEKPLAHTLAGAVRIAETDARTPGRLAVGYQMRYEASCRRLAWLCQNGWIGEIRSAVVERSSYIPHLNHGKEGWWGSWEVAGGGVLMTQLIHELDLLLTVMGRPVSVSAQMDTRYSKIESEDYLEMSVRFENGTAARSVVSVNSGKLGGQFTIHGTGGTIGLPSTLMLQEPGREAAAVKAVDEALPETRARSQSIISRGFRSVARRLGFAEGTELSPHARLYLAIVDSIQRGAPLPNPPAEALRSLELCMAAYESALAGKEISLPLNSTSAVYNGISKQDYDDRKCPRTTGELASLER